MTSTSLDDYENPDRLMRYVGFRITCHAGGFPVWERPGTVGCVIWISDETGGGQQFDARNPAMVCVFTGSGGGSEGFFNALAPSLAAALEALDDGRILRHVEAGQEIFGDFGHLSPSRPALRLVRSMD